MIYDEDDSEAEHVAMDSIWALVQNNEYVFSQVFQPYDIFPGKRDLLDIAAHFQRRTSYDRVNSFALAEFAFQFPQLDIALAKHRKIRSRNLNWLLATL